MAARLEAEVSHRVGNIKGKKQLIEIPSGQEQEAQENMLISPDNCCAKRLEGPEEELSNAFQEFFLNLKFATLDDNPARSFQLLKHARSIAKELLIR